MRLWMEAINASNVSSLIVVVASCFTMMQDKWVRGYHRGLTVSLLSISQRNEINLIKKWGDL